MSNQSENPPAPMSREQMMASLFANMVVQQANMAFMFLGKVPHPETGEVIQDIESAKFFIDQIEMLEVKTKGNLSKQEEGLVKQSLTALRMAFVETIGGAEAPAPEAGQIEEPTMAPVASEPVEPVAVPAPEPKPADEESRKKFSKKY